LRQARIFQRHIDGGCQTRRAVDQRAVQIEGQCADRAEISHG